MNSFAQAEWYCVLNGARIGPMSWTTLRQRIGRGQLGPGDWVWTAAFGEEWHAVAAVPGLWREARPAPPSPLPQEMPLPQAEEAAPEPPVAAESFEAATGHPRIWQAWQRAWRSMWHALLMPFDLVRWFSIAFCVWLMRIGGTNMPSFIDAKALQAQIKAGGGVTLSYLAELFREGLQRAVAAPFPSRQLVFNLLITVFYGVLFCWLRARGSFMLLHRLEQPGSTVRRAWQIATATAHSLFIWRVVVMVIGWLALAGILGGALYSLGLPLLRAGKWEALGSLITLQWLKLWGGGLLLLLTLWRVVASLSYHLMEPLLYCYRDGVMAAWQRVWLVCRDHPWAMVRYYLSLVLLDGLSLLVYGLFIIMSFGIGLVVLFLPVVGRMALLPLHWFHRALGVSFLKQIKFE